MPLDEINSTEVDKSQNPQRVIELPRLEAFKGSEEIVPIKAEHIQEYTTPTPKPKHQKKPKKKKPKFRVIDDDIPLPKIEIIRSQPVKPEKKPQAAASKKDKKAQPEKQ